MNKPHVLKLGGLVLAGITAAAHIFVGTFDTLLPLLQSELPPMVKGTFHAIWHFCSVFLAASVWRFWKGDAFASWLALLWIGFAISFVVAGLSMAGLSGLLIVPQWIFLGAAGGLILLAQRKAD